MQISTKAWRNYIDRMSQISKKAADEMQAWISKHGFSDDQALLEYAYALSTHYGEAIGALSCQMYEATAAAQGIMIKDAEAAATPDFKEVARAVHGTMKQSANKVPATVGRLVKQVGADTTLKNAERDGAQFAWIPSGDTCAFCLTLASRGWQYMSKKALKNGHAEHIHANCDCQYAIRLDGKSTVEGYDSDNYLEMYYDAEGNTPQERINAMRREFYQENKDRINKQKRLVYKEHSDEPKPLIKSVKNGILDIKVDEFTPCLRDTKTGQLIDTEVYKITKASSLKGYNVKNGWNVDWQKVCKQHDVYALTIKGQNEIQGLIGISYNKETKGMYLAWASAAPWNTKQHSVEQRYKGVGGHLFAIAAEKTLEIDKHGYMYGYAKNEAVMNHYIEKLHAEYLGIFHQYHIVIDTDGLLELLKEYNYEWRK